MASNPKIVHMEDIEKKQHYLCNIAVGKGNVNKLSRSWNFVTCKNCLNYKPSPTNETVNHPEHYNFGTIEVIDVIEDWKLDFHLGNAVKYIARAFYKGNTIEDLRKANWYIKKKLKLLERKQNGRYI